MNAGINLSVLVDDFWVMQLENNIYFIDQTTDDILERQGPESAAMQRTATVMVNDTQIAMDQLEKGVANLDNVAFEDANASMTHATDSAQLVHGLIASFCQMQGRQ